MRRRNLPQGILIKKTFSRRSCPSTIKLKSFITEKHFKKIIKNL